MFPVPGSLVDSWLGGWCHRKNLKIPDLSDISDYLQVQWSTVVAYFHAGGYGEKRWRLLITAEHFHRHPSKIHNATNRTFLESLKLQLGAFVPGAAAQECPLSVWYGFLSTSPEAPACVKLYMAEKATDGVGAQYHPKTFIGPSSDQTGTPAGPGNVANIIVTNGLQRKFRSSLSLDS
jgi:hypothetical protein